MAESKVAKSTCVLVIVAPVKSIVNFANLAVEPIVLIFPKHVLTSPGLVEVKDNSL